MALVWNTVAVPAIVGMAVAWTMSGLVLRAGPQKPLNRRLAFVLFMDGIASGAGNGLKYVVDDPRHALALHVIAGTATWVMTFAYLAFVSLALRTPLLDWLRTRGGAWFMLVGATAGAAYFILDPASVGPSVHRVGYAPWEGAYGGGALLILLWGSLVLLFGLVAAISSYRRTAEGTVARQRAAAYLMAFAVRDSVIAVMFPILAFFPANEEVAVGFIVFVAAAETIYPMVLAYAILRFQVLDIEMRLKVTIRKATVLAIFIAVFVMATELADSLLSDRFGMVVGAAATTALVLAIRPIERAAARVADAAMPRVDGSAEYDTYRRFEIYRAALEAGYEDMQITARERAVLERLRSELAISDADASRLEEALRVRLGQAKAPPSATA